MDYRVASFGERALATILDYVIIYLPFILAGKILPTGWAGKVFEALSLLYETSCLTLYGKTLGKHLVKLRVIAVEGNLDLRKVLLRTFIPGIMVYLDRDFAVLTLFVIIIDYLWYFQNPQGRTFHDLAGQTMVVKELAREITC